MSAGSKQNEPSFLDKLAAMRAANCDDLPTPELAALSRGVAQLRRSDILQKCLQPGETAPNFTFVDDHMQSCNLYQLLNDGPVVINFFRGFWCSYCSSELEAMAAIETTLASKGCHYLAISPQKPEVNGDVFDTYPVLFDKNNAIATQFNIVYELSADEISLFESWDLKIDEVNETGNWLLPLPATYIIGQDHVVAFQFTDVDFRRRCCPNELLEALVHLGT